MVLGKNILQALFLKGTSNVPPRGGKKDSTFELQGVAREISLSKAVKMESYFWFQGERTCWSQSGINLKSGWRKMQKISKSLNLYHKIAKQMMTWGRNFLRHVFLFYMILQGKLNTLPTSSVYTSLTVLPTSFRTGERSNVILLPCSWVTRNHTDFLKEQKARPREGGSHSSDGTL